MTGDSQIKLEPEKPILNTRILRGRYFAELFIEDALAGPIFHWTVCMLDKSTLIALGQQDTYEIACQEARHHLMLLAEADKLASPCAPVA